MERGNSLVDLPLGCREFLQERLVMFPGRVGLSDQAIIAPRLCLKQAGLMINEKGDLTPMGPDEPPRIKFQGDQPTSALFFSL